MEIIGPVFKILARRTGNLLATSPAALLQLEAIEQSAGEHFAAAACGSAECPLECDRRQTTSRELANIPRRRLALSAPAKWATRRPPAA